MNLTSPSERRPAPTILLCAQQTWGGLSVAQLSASAGLHETPASNVDRLLFYTTGPVSVACRAGELRQVRMQAAGEFDVLPAGCDGSWEDDGPSEMAALQISPGIFASAAEDLKLSAGRGVRLKPRLGARDPHVEHVVRGILAELHAPSPSGRLYVDALAVALARRLLETVGDAVPEAPARGLSKQQMRRIEDYVEAHLDQSVTLTDIATAAGVSVSHLTPLFRRTTGQTAHRYVMERRVERARLLLAGADASIAQIALQTGFSHQSHLAVWMRRLLGVTPSQLRDARNRTD